MLWGRSINVLDGESHALDSRMGWDAEVIRQGSDVGFVTALWNLDPVRVQNGVEFHTFVNQTLIFQ